MEQKAFIFDIDGTLLNSVDLHAESWAETLRRFGYETPLREIRRRIGEGADRLLAAILPETAHNTRNTIEQVRAHLYRRAYLPKVKPFPRVAELLQRLKSDGHKVLLASSCTADEIDRYKAIARIRELVDCEVTSSDVEASKPAPDIFAKAQQLCQMRPADCIAVGDTIYDAQSATEAGLHFYGVACGASTVGELKDAGAKDVFKNPANMLAHYPTFLTPQPKKRTLASTSVARPEPLALRP
jgi:HAD superfamily hydrolase (TIGR01549 family)